MNKELMQTNESDGKQQLMFAKFGDGRWYAILPGMEVGLRKAGAEVCLIPENVAVENS
ncbi:hypothetical protein ACFFKC_05835 [Pseudoduganella danionis]|uniref:Uncharacterized protein n=1 Tax=Pseudoduganella danionis TaxID=1890295 RepID=A0ABW9SQ39_9BURK|nr:hypothetical protein [Pseudoduganella danionis]MTW34277.1 hypothetical protein [Pseudoduganella danionis]